MEKDTVLDGDYVSLFDYLGKPAGGQLGQVVYQFAKERKASVKQRHVSTQKYTGNVQLYQRSLLDEYFHLNSM